MSENFLTAFATLFVLIDPIGLTPMFAALTAGATSRQRVGIALRAVLISGGILVVFGLFGELLLHTLGIELSAFRVAGGLMLFLVAVDMLFQKRTERRTKEVNKSSELDDDPSVFPLATPLIAGPGALAAMMLLSAQMDGAAELGLYLGAGLVLAICMISFMATGAVERLLGDAGIRVLTRVFGMLLGALAVQFIFDGVLDFLQRAQ